MNEILDNLRHLVISASAREIGIIRKEQVINIIDSVVTRPIFEMGEGTPSVDIKGSVVTRPLIKTDEEKKKREDERLRREKEEQERLRRQKEEEAQAQRETEEKERRRGEEEQRQRDEEESGRIEEEQRGEKQKKYEAFLLKQKKEGEERKLREDRERRGEAEIREKEKQKKIQEEERQRSQGEEIARIQREKEYEPPRIEHQTKSSGGKWFFGVIIILVVLALGWYGTQDSSSSAISTPQKTTPSVTTTPVMTAKVTPSAAAAVTLSADRNTLTNSIGMEFVQIPAGEFDMGSPSNEKDRVSNEGPIHHVKISKAFYMGKYEVTWKQWREIMGNNPNFAGIDMPANGVSWNDVQEFIKKLNLKEGTDKYRLPSESEWEYAARAGTNTTYFFGDTKLELGDYAWFRDNSGDEPHPVGQKKPNPWGLYDIYGNVQEWVQDKSHGNYSGAPVDGSAWESGDSQLRATRGGNFNYCANDARSSRRGTNVAQGSSGNYIGFRLVRDV